MKKRLSALLCILLAAAMLLASCSSDDGEVVMSYGEASVNENLYIYMLALGKSTVLQNFSGTTTDIPELWDTEMGVDSNGEMVTYGKMSYIDQQLDIKTKLFFADYALTHGGELTDDEKKEITKQLDTIVNSEQFGGSEAALNKFLETFTMDYDKLEDYYELEALYAKGMSLAFSEGGEYEVPIEDAMTYYKNNYVTVRHIAIGTEYAGVDEDGNKIYYTEEEKEGRKKIIEEICAGLESGESFEKYETLSEDGFAESNPNGYTITKGVLGTAMAGYEKVAFSLKEGEFEVFELEGTGTYIIQRMPLSENDFRNCYSTIMASLVDAASAQAVIDNEKNFKINKELVDSYNMKMIPVLG